MKSLLPPEKAGENAAAIFGESYHCAEAVVASVLEAFGVTNRQEAIRHATAFGGGFGKSFTETCGALSGAMIAIGHFHGREQAGESWDIPALLGDEVVSVFADTHRTCNCGTLRERFGEEEQMNECRKLVLQTTTMVVDLLNRKMDLDKEPRQS